MCFYQEQGDKRNELLMGDFMVVWLGLKLKNQLKTKTSGQWYGFIDREERVYCVYKFQQCFLKSVELFCLRMDAKSNFKTFD